MQLTWARWAPLARSQTPQQRGGLQTHLTCPPFRSCIPVAPRKARQRLTSGGHGRGRRFAVRVAPSAGGQDMTGSAALLGLLLSFAGYGASTAVKDFLEERREKELLARAKARHEAFVQSGEAEDDAEAECAAAAAGAQFFYEEQLVAVTAQRGSEGAMLAPEELLAVEVKSSAPTSQVGVVDVVAGGAAVTQPEQSTVEGSLIGDPISSVVSSAVKASGHTVGEGLGSSMAGSDGVRDSSHEGDAGRLLTEESPAAGAAPLHEVIEEQVVSPEVVNVETEMPETEKDTPEKNGEGVMGGVKGAEAAEAFKTISASEMGPVGGLQASEVGGGTGLASEEESAARLEATAVVKGISDSGEVKGACLASEIDSAESVEIAAAHSAMSNSAEVEGGSTVSVMDSLEIAEKAVVVEGVDDSGEVEGASLATAMDSVEGTEEAAVVEGINDSVGNVEVAAAHSAVSVSEEVEGASDATTRESVEGATAVEAMSASTLEKGNTRESAEVMKAASDAEVVSADEVKTAEVEGAAAGGGEVVAGVEYLEAEEMDGGSDALRVDAGESIETVEVMKATTATAESVAFSGLANGGVTDEPQPSSEERAVQSRDGLQDVAKEEVGTEAAVMDGDSTEARVLDGEDGGVGAEEMLPTEFSEDLTELDFAAEAAGIQILQAIANSSVESSSDYSIAEEDVEEAGAREGGMAGSAPLIAAEAVREKESAVGNTAVASEPVETVPVSDTPRTNGSQPLEFPAGATNGGSSSPKDHTVELHYYSGWERAMVHGSVAGAAWESYATKKGKLDGWHSFSCDVRASEGTPLLEFVMTNNEKSDWDKPMDGSNYIIQEPGVYTLRNGVLSKCPPVPLFMVVSDLDGTMVGNDDSTSAFKKYWESGPLLMGCKLVYSTGRSLQLFQQLSKEKAGVLAQPDILILGVGTEVYHRGKGNDYVKDNTWSQVLDKGWNLEVVRDAAYAALAEVGKDSMHFRPPSEQNDHKVTCGVRTEELDRVVDIIRRKIEGRKVDANIISSGQGDWRYLDLVSNQAGKLESLEYVAKAEGFPLDRTVACGDSGNDILMLAGKNRAIVVGNAQDDLRRWVDQNPEAVAVREDGRSRLRVSEAHEAKGILEGLRYFGFRE